MGGLRFLPPQPVQAWSDPLDLTGDSTAVCPQRRSGEVIGVEDCLYMNIYAPLQYTGNGNAVMVWIYGGGFINGNNKMTEYGPDYYLDQGIVVVVPNYRTGILGFYSLSTEQVPGNQGLLDQLAALQTVQAVIASFGGDPNAVTLAGQSAGSSSTLYHLMSPRSQGLFHQGWKFMSCSHF